MVENRYLYTVGTYRVFSGAAEFEKELTKLNLTNTRIHPYLDGERIDDARGILLIEKYPDLQYYFEGTK